jgi:hypothetical protein
MGLLQYADRAIRTATIAYTGCHTQNRVAGNSHSGWTAGTRDPRTHCTADTHIRTTAGMSRIRIHSSRSTRADTRADVPCDERPQRFLE